MEYKFLNNINSPEDLKKLHKSDLEEYAVELRDFIITSVSKTGGHLASSLGAVELTIALHYVFDTPTDKLLWDVGHQAYPHKIITGRRDEFHTLRKYKGVSGFTKRSESEYDAFGTGHASTTISAGLGMATARDIKGEDFEVLSIIGDGSMTAGMAFEGLNQAGHLDKKFVVILNDNEMSISENVGALSAFLSRRLTGRLATRLKKEIEVFLKSIPMIGGSLTHWLSKAEDSLVTFFTPGMIFEGFGFHYVGPIDGHDLKGLVKLFNEVKNMEGPVFLHIMTKKGKGYKIAEDNPQSYHGVGPFDIVTGKGPAKKTPANPSYTEVFSRSLLEVMDNNKKVVAISAAMPEGTGLDKIKNKMPERFFDVGIAEQHALTFAAGLACEDVIPVCAIYSTFMQRAFDQVMHDVCLQKLPVIMAMDRAGLVGADGPTHHGSFDISFLRSQPNLIFAAPKDGAELRDLLHSSVDYKMPVALRYPRGNTPDELPNYDGGDVTLIEAGKGELLKEGKDVTIVALGVFVETAMEAEKLLKEKGINAEVINGRFIKPLDEDLIINSVKKTGRLVTIEENALQGGFGSAVIELLSDKNINCLVTRMGLPDKFIEHGTQDELRDALGLNAEGISKKAFELVTDGKNAEQIAN